MLATPRRRRFRTVVAAFVALATASVCVWAGGVGTPPARADSTAVSTVYKTGRDAATGSTASSPGAPGHPGGVTGDAHPGDTIDWTVSYANSTAATARVDVRDLLTKAGSYVPGSLVVPPNPTPGQAYTPQYSTDSGLTWQSGSPPSGADGVGLVGSVPGGASATRQLSPAFGAPKGISFQTSSGDGYNGVSYDGNEVYASFHGSGGNNYLFCSTIANAICPGWPALSTYASPVAGTPIGTGSNGMKTPGQNGTFIVGTHLYWLAETQAATGGRFAEGVMCLDVVSLRSCGFTQIDSTTHNNNNTSRGQLGGTGIPADDGRYYFQTPDDGDMACFDAATQTACGVVQLAPGVRSGAAGSWAASGTYGDYFFGSTWSGGANQAFTCYQFSTASVCPGYPVIAADNTVRAPTPILSRTGAVTGVCWALHNFAYCWGLNGQAAPNPYPGNSGPASSNNAGDGYVYQGTKVYFGVSTGSAVACYDFALWSGTGAVPRCSGFVNVSNSGNYTVRPFAGQDGCAIADGHSGQIATFNWSGGGNGGCQFTATSVRATPVDSYCGTGAASFRSWSQLLLNGLVPTAYHHATVTITDANGATVPGFSNVNLNAGTTALNISGIPRTGATATLSATVSLFGISNAAGVSGGTVSLTWQGDPVQLCFKTVAPTLDCGETTTLTNDATAVTDGTAGSDAPAGNSSGPASFTVTGSDTQCHLVIAKAASPPHASPGDRVTYTVTVTNAGTLDYAAAHPATFTDDLSGVLQNATYQDDATASTGSASYTAPVLSWTGPLAPGASATITYSVLTDAAVDGTSLSNTVQSASEGTNCAAGSADRACTAVVPFYALAVDKSAQESEFTHAGQLIHYSFVVTNRGSVVVDGIAVSDQGALDAPPLCPATPVPPGGSVTCTATHTVTAADVTAGSIVDRATASGRAPNGDAILSPGSQIVVVPGKTFSVMKTASVSSASPGDTVSYTIVVTNTGTTAYTAGDPASFSDHLIDVLDDAAYNGDAAATSGTVSYASPSLTWSGPLAVGGSATITYSVTIDVPDTGDKLLSNVIAPTATGGSCSGSCTVSTPVASYHVVKTAAASHAQPGDPIDYTITVTNDGHVAFTDTTPASFTDDLSQVLDDAAYNDDAAATSGTVRYAAPVLSWSGALAVGAAAHVTFSVTVGNGGGDGNLHNVVVTPGTEGNCPPGGTDSDCTLDEPAAGYTVAKTASTAQTFPGGVVRYSVTVTNVGGRDYTVARPASFIDELTGVLDDATYNGDATQGATLTGDTLSWSGPLAIGAQVVITYSVTVKSQDAADHLLQNTVVATGGGGACATASSCSTLTAVRSFSVHKSASTATTTPGGRVTYTIMVTNTGAAAYTDADPARFTDDLSGVLDDAVYNGDATNGAAVSGGVLSWSGPLAVGDSVTIAYSVTVDDPVAGDGILANSVTPGPEGDCLDPSACSTSTPVGSYEVRKTATPGTAFPGQVVAYTVTVHNTGQMAYTAADPAAFTDDLSGVVLHATYNGDIAASDGVGSVSGALVSWYGPLPVGATVTVTYSVTVDAVAGQDNALGNRVDPTARGGSCADATSCAVDTAIGSYTVGKTASSTSVVPGQRMTYTITVKNTGQVPYTAADPAAFTDDLTAVLQSSRYNGDASGGAVFTGNAIDWAGVLPVGGTATVTYSVTVDDPVTGPAILQNEATPTAPGGGCDPVLSCSTLVPIAAYSVAKASSPAVARPGTVVQYQVWLVNHSDGDYTAAHPAAFADDLSGVLDDARYNGDATDGATLTGTTLSWSGPLASGQTVIIRYSVTVDAPDPGDHALKNVVAPTAPGGDCRLDSDSPDIPDTCDTVTPVQAYTVTKIASTGSAVPGSTVDYTVTVDNVGQVAYTAVDPATVVDDLTGVLDDAVYNSDATASAGSVAYAAPRLSWSGPLPVGGSATITYSVTVGAPDTGDHRLRNTATPDPLAGGGCGTACATDTPVASVRVAKTSTATRVDPGSVIPYTITVTNTGQVPFTAAQPAAVVDDLSGVLRHASYNGDARSTDGSVAVSGVLLTWQGPLAIGATATISYSVTVEPDATGPIQLVNTVTTTGQDGGNCPPGTTDPACSLVLPPPSYTVAKAAAPATAHPGGIETYTIVARNTGPADYTTATPATVTDDLTGVLDDATYRGDATATAGTVTVSGSSLRWTGPLPVGGTATITYSVLVGPAGHGDGVLVNSVSATATGGTCDAGGSCSTRTPVASYSVQKTAGTSTATIGAPIAYTITVHNTGAGDYAAAAFTDDLTAVLTNAGYNGDAAASAGTLAYSAPMLSWTGPLAVGATVTIAYTVTPTTPGHVSNTVTTPTGAGGSCEAAMLSAGPGPGCSTDTTIAPPAAEGGAPMPPAAGALAPTGTDVTPGLVVALFTATAAGAVFVGLSRRRGTRRP